MLAVLTVKVLRHNMDVSLPLHVVTTVHSERYMGAKKFFKNKQNYLLIPTTSDTN